ncbi:MAG: hypothetical protein JXR96_30885 [Deltaproteobacteria bacterium]|nr:hypothetical protein [Deltaproteobacteria bacterium]
MKMRKPWILFCALLALPASARAASPEAMLKLCLRDGKNVIRRLERDLRMGYSSFMSFEKNCIQGPKAEAIKGLDGYAEVQKIYEQASGMLRAAKQGMADQAAADEKQALSAGPGGDAMKVRSRWSAQPARCRSPEAWDQASGAARPKSKGAARISGLDDEPAAGSARAAHKRLFAGLDNSGRWPRDFTPDDHLARIACGKNIEGIDPFFDERRHTTSPQFLQGDSRAALGEAIIDRAGDASRQVLYRVALAHECFVNTAWDIKRGYVPYVFCADALGAAPSADEVRRALEQVWPGRDYERDNLLFILERAARAKGEVDAAFARMESRYPRMKSVYRDAADEARRRYAARREKYAAAYRLLDPLTATLLDDPATAPPPDCEQTLLGLRAKLAAELKPGDGAGVRELRVGHPLGYQISEALCWCYLGKDKLAKAKIEADALRKGNRRITLAEEIAFSRLDALEKVKQELKTAGKIEQAIPNYQQGAYGVPLPGTVHRSPRFDELVSRRARFETLGDSERKPAVLAAIQGSKLVFKKHKYVRKYRDIQCKETNKVDRYEIAYNPNGTTSLRPIYRQDCWEVGPVKKETIVHQERPVVLTAGDAAGLAVGMQVIVLDNTQKEGDAALVHLWSPAKGREKASLVDGVKVR